MTNLKFNSYTTESNTYDNNSEIRKSKDESFKDKSKEEGREEG